jgi:hypothetical protein
LHSTLGKNVIPIPAFLPRPAAITPRGSLPGWSSPARGCLF